MKFIFSLLILFSFSSSVFAEEAPKTKSAARAEVDAALDKIENQINTMEAKTKELSGKARAEWESAIEDLKKNGRKLREEIKEERATGESKAKDFWGKMKAAVGELQAGVESAAKKFKEKPEEKK